MTEGTGMAPKPKPAKEATDLPASAPDDVSITGSRRVKGDERRSDPDDEAGLETFEERVDRNAGSA
jgi:hypothetical protein